MTSDIAAATAAGGSSSGSPGASRGAATLLAPFEKYSRHTAGRRWGLSLLVERLDEPRVDAVDVVHRRCFARAPGSVENFSVATVLVDAENVRRSVWPNVGPDELVRRCARWGAAEGHEVVVVFDGLSPGAAEPDVTVLGSGPESADDCLVRLAAEAHGPVWLVTSDRGLRRRVGSLAERVIGGGSFVRELPSG
jgi:hypothetical protein